MAPVHDAQDGSVGAEILAGLFEVTVRRIQQLAKEGVIPKSGRGRYPLAAAIKGYIRKLKEDSWSGEGDPDKMEPFKRRAFYQSEREKLHLALERGDVVPAIEVERRYGNRNKAMVHAIATAVDVLERDVGLTGKQAAKLEAHFNLLRVELHRLATEDDAASDVSKRGGG